MGFACKAEAGGRSGVIALVAMGLLGFDKLPFGYEGVVSDGEGISDTEFLAHAFDMSTSTLTASKTTVVQLSFLGEGRKDCISD